MIQRLTAADDDNSGPQRSTKHYCYGNAIACSNRAAAGLRILMYESREQLFIMIICGGGADWVVRVVLKTSANFLKYLTFEGIFSETNIRLEFLYIVASAQKVG
jgi:hypothetical protein